MSQKRPCPPQLLLALISQAATIVVATCHVGLTAQKERRGRRERGGGGRERAGKWNGLSLSLSLLPSSSSSHAESALLFGGSTAAAATSKSWLDLIPSNFYCTWKGTVSSCTDLDKQNENTYLICSGEAAISDISYLAIWLKSNLSVLKDIHSKDIQRNIIKCMVPLSA